MSRLRSLADQALRAPLVGWTGPLRMHAMREDVEGATVTRDQRLELLAYMCTTQLVLVVYATHQWWAATGLFGLFLVGAGPKTRRSHRTEMETSAPS